MGEACTSVVNKLSNRTEELSSLSLPIYPLQFGARDQDCVPEEHAGRWMTLGQ